MIDISCDSGSLEPIDIDQYRISWQANAIVSFYPIDSAIKKIGVAASKSSRGELYLVKCLVIGVIAGHCIRRFDCEADIPPSIFLSWKLW